MSAPLRTLLPKPCCCAGNRCSGTITSRPFLEVALHITTGCERVYASGSDCMIAFLTGEYGDMQARFDEARAARRLDHIAAAKGGRS